VRDLRNPVLLGEVRSPVPRQRTRYGWCATDAILLCLFDLSLLDTGGKVILDQPDCPCRVVIVVSDAPRAAEEPRSFLRCC